uniref:Uncharacterized protein n=1 Tax=Romanomermis culicivorax TaxID=13658 RepID=A0A915HL28_ROMCU
MEQYPRKRGCLQCKYQTRDLGQVRVLLHDLRQHLDKSQWIQQAQKAELQLTINDLVQLNLLIIDNYVGLGDQIKGLNESDYSKCHILHNNSKDLCVQLSMHIFELYQNNMDNTVDEFINSKDQN